MLYLLRIIFLHTEIRSICVKNSRRIVHLSRKIVFFILLLIKCFSLFRKLYAVIHSRRNINKCLIGVSPFFVKIIGSNSLPSLKFGDSNGGKCEIWSHYQFLKVKFYSKRCSSHGLIDLEPRLREDFDQK